MEMSREILYNQLAGGFASLYDRRETEVFQRLATPGQSFVSDFYSTLDKLYLLFDQQGELCEAPLPQPTLTEIASYAEKMAEDYRITEAPESKRETLLVQHIEREINSKELIGASTSNDLLQDVKVDVCGIFTLANIAILNKPPKVDKDTLFRKRPKETHEQKVFRCAMLALTAPKPQNILSSAEQSLNKNIHSRGRAALTQALKDPDARHIAGSLVAKLRLHALRDVLSENVLRSNVTTASFLDEIHLGYSMETMSEQDNPIPTTETDWTIFPDAVSDEQGQPQSRPSEDISPSHEVNRPPLQPQRLRFLGQLALQWGENAYTAVSKLRQGREQYRVVVLPQTLPNGQVIEHAIADNPLAGNALYVFRGESGLGSNGQILRTWKEVFDKHRGNARQLGAQRFYHSSQLEEKVLNYLTMNPSDLDHQSVSAKTVEHPN